MGFHPFLDFGDGDEGGMGALGDFEGVANVIAVTVGDENVVGRDGGGRDVVGALGIALEEGVDEDVFVLEGEMKASMAEISDLVCHWFAPSG